ncbi:MAG: lamin tail domain-containing protein, partial [Deltaproteobacteria bacterium]|nr:lamin tail domain-containing protein [Deltaproteobacteria bacterium]
MFVPGPFRSILFLALLAALAGCGNDRTSESKDTGGPSDLGPHDPGNKPDLKLVFDPGKDPAKTSDVPDGKAPDDGATADIQDIGEDGSGKDSGDQADADVVPQVINPGDVIFTEILLNPPGTTDAKLEAVELYNTTDHQIDLNGWVLSDDGKDHAILDSCGPIIIPPKGYIVLSRSQDWVTQGTAACEYGGFILSNTEDEAILSLPDGKLVDAVRYSADKGFPKTDGPSIQLSLGAYDHLKNDIGSNWCLSTQQTTGPGSV